MSGTGDIAVIIVNYGTADLVVQAVDSVLVPVGGGGLLAGVAAAVRRLCPDAQVFGVEPVGAASMRRSLEAGHPVELESVSSVADGLKPVRPGDLTYQHARALVSDLISWHLWCDIRGRKGEQKQVHNNIRSLSLARAAGYQGPGWQDIGTAEWLTIWGKAVGRKEIERMLKQQGVDTNRTYSSVLENL